IMKEYFALYENAARAIKELESLAENRGQETADARMRAFRAPSYQFFSVQTCIIDGNAIARELRAGLIRRVAALAATGVRPGLAVVQVGNHPASRIYVRNKIKACGEAGLYSEHIELPADA